MAERKSPYLTLGVPYGASKNEAARAFAKATRRLRGDSNPPFDLEDLNWALHAIEQRIQDPATSIDDYRMPAAPGIYDLSSGEGILNPPAVQYHRRTPPSTGADLDALRAAVILEVADQVAAECRESSLPRLHSFGSSPAGLVADSPREETSTSRPRTSLKKRVWIEVLTVILVIAGAAAVVVAIASNPPRTEAEKVEVVPAISVTPVPADTAAMMFTAQLATDSRAYDVCDGSCWIWDITPSESCGAAELKLEFFRTENSAEPSSSRTLAIGELAAGVVRRVIVPVEPDDPDYSAPARLACTAAAE